MPRHLPIYLRTLRKRWTLSLGELALLLHLTKGGVSLIETQERRPSVDVVLGTEIIFGESPRKAFPALYSEIEDQIMRQAKTLYDRVEGRSDLNSIEKLRLLEGMVKRLGGDAFDV